MSTETNPADGTEMPIEPELAPAPGLQSAYGKLAWALTLLKQTQQAYDYYLTQTRPYRIDAHPRPEKRHMDFSIHAINGTLLSFPLAAGAADVIHNARCWQRRDLTGTTRLTISPMRWRSFRAPTRQRSSSSASPFRSLLRRRSGKPEGRLKLLVEATRDLIREVQVFADGGVGPGFYYREGPYRLSELDRTDRHPELNVTPRGLRQDQLPRLKPRSRWSGVSR